MEGYCQNKSNQSMLKLRKVRGYRGGEKVKRKGEDVTFGAGMKQLRH